MKVSAAIERIRGLSADLKVGPEGLARETKHSDAQILTELKGALYELTASHPQAFFKVSPNQVEAIGALSLDYDTAEGYVETQDLDLPIDEPFQNLAVLRTLATLEAQDAPGTRPVVAKELEESSVSTRGHI